MRLSLYHLITHIRNDFKIDTDTFIYVGMRIHNLKQKYKYFNIDNKYFHKIKFETHSLNSPFMKVNFKDYENENKYKREYSISPRLYIYRIPSFSFSSEISSQMR